MQALHVNLHSAGLILSVMPLSVNSLEVSVGRTGVTIQCKRDHRHIPLQPPVIVLSNIRHPSTTSAPPVFQ
jgi:hypothetical protein